jgi:cytochrome c oxidase assembly protein subunit 15
MNPSAPLTARPLVPADKPVARVAVMVWIASLVVLVYAMILVGGATRLTDSGLSITEWAPLTGAIPPLSAADWQVAFADYQTTTQYRAVNEGMSLEAFKIIYWWEWGHRQLGRMIGVVFLVPFLAFLALGWMSRGLAARMGAVFLLGGVQAFIGWWMVQSGLGETERVQVAPYRLMTHFMLALLIFGGLAWTFLSVWGEHRRPLTSTRRMALIGWHAVGMVVIQMALGALVAGLDAGRTYTDWPLMAGHFVPEHYGAVSPWWRDPFENMASAQFHHRIGGYVLLALALWFAFAARGKAVSRTATLFAGVCVAQLVVGIVTVLYAAPVNLALVHQGLGVVLWLLAIASVHPVIAGRVPAKAALTSDQPAPV